MKANRTPDAGASMINARVDRKNWLRIVEHQDQWCARDDRKAQRARALHANLYPAAKQYDAIIYYSLLYVSSFVSVCLCVCILFARWRADFAYARIWWSLVCSWLGRNGRCVWRGDRFVDVFVCAYVWEMCIIHELFERSGAQDKLAIINLCIERT